MGSLRDLVAIHCSAGLCIDARTAATRWRGERMDHGQAIDSLLFRSQAATGAPLATS